MTFSEAIEATPDLVGAYQRGLRALREVDRSKITANVPRNLGGSVDLDSTLAARYPDDPRWDYGVAARSVGQERVYWIEVHSGTDGEIRAVLGKIRWLKRWLETSAAELNSLPREFVWISSGRATVTQRSPRLRQLALEGVVFKGGHFSIP